MFKIVVSDTTSVTEFDFQYLQLEVMWTGREFVAFRPKLLNGDFTGFGQ